MSITLYDQAPPAAPVTQQVLDMVATYITDLSMLAVPPSNHLYELYKWALPCEVYAYIDRIGKDPAAPVELLVAFNDEQPTEVVGFVMYLPVPTHPDACGITYMAVKSARRRKGIGKGMLHQVIGRYPHVELTCPVSKVGFYECEGFRVLDTHNTQIVMNTREASTSGLMGIVDVVPIYESPQAQVIRDQQMQRWGRKEMLNAEKQLRRHVEQLKRHAEAYVRGRLEQSA